MSAFRVFCLSAFLIALAQASPALTPAPAGEEPDLRIQLFETSSTVVALPEAPWRVLDTSGKVAAMLPPNQETTLTLENGRVTIGTVALDPTSSGPYRLQGETTGSTIRLGAAAAQEMRQYQGKIELLPHADSSVSVIGLLLMEEYLKGVVPHEIGTDSPTQAKCAQAVAARSFAMLSLSSGWHRGRGFHMCSTVCCQVYGGIGKGTPDSDASVQQTRGQVLTFEGKPIPAYYAGHCGGFTEDIRVSWPDRKEQRAYHGSQTFDGSEAPQIDLTKEAEFKQWLQSSPACYCNPEHFKVPAWAGKNLRWTREVTAEELTRFVARRQDVGRIVAIRPGERGASGRLKTAEFVGENGVVQAGPEYNIRRVFEPYLKSGAFTVEAKGGTPERPESFVLSGAGSGHGVGMCQTGAMGMANAGHNFPEILKHYYSNATVEKKY